MQTPKMPFDWGDDLNVVQDANPEDISKNTGAATIGNPPVSLTGAMTDYVKRPFPLPNSLGLFMDEHQMVDAGVHPKQLGALPAYSVIDATGAGDLKPDPAKAISLARTMVTGAHSAASALAVAPATGKALAEGASHFAEAPSGASAKAAFEATRGAFNEAARHPVVAGLKTLNKIYSVPLYAAEGVARGVGDYRNDAPLGETILGNGMRTGLVVSASRVPFAGPGLAWAANRYLPDGAAMGHGVILGLSDPEQSRAALSAIP